MQVGGFDWRSVRACQAGSISIRSFCSFTDLSVGVCLCAVTAVRILGAVAHVIERKGILFAKEVIPQDLHHHHHLLMRRDLFECG